MLRVKDLQNLLLTNFNEFFVELLAGKCRQKVLERFSASGGTYICRRRAIMCDRLLEFLTSSIA
jgi:hypothetical protein